MTYFQEAKKKKTCHLTLRAFWSCGYRNIQISIIKRKTCVYLPTTFLKLILKIHGQTRFLINFNNLTLWYKKRIKTLLLVVLKTQKVCKKGKSNQNYCLEGR